MGDGNAGPRKQRDFLVSQMDRVNGQKRRIDQSEVSQALDVMGAITPDVKERAQKGRNDDE